MFYKLACLSWSCFGPPAISVSDNFGNPIGHFVTGKRHRTMRSLERARTLVDLQHDKGVVNALASGSSSLPITILSSAQQRCCSRPSTASTVTEDNDGDMGSSFSNMSMTDIQNLKSSARCGNRTGCPTWITPAAHPGVLLLLHTEPTRPLPRSRQVGPGGHLSIGAL